MESLPVSSVSTPEEASDDDCDLGTIRLVLQVRYFAKPGEFLLVVGDTAGLGEWDVNKALPLELSDSQQDLWSMEVCVPCIDLEYEFVAKSALKTVHFSRRCLKLSDRASERVVHVSDGLGLQSLNLAHSGLNSQGQDQSVSSTRRHTPTLRYTPHKESSVSSYSSRSSISSYLSHEPTEQQPKMRVLIKRLGDIQTRLTRVGTNLSSQKEEKYSEALDDVQRGIDELRRQFFATIAKNKSTQDMEEASAKRPIVGDRLFEHVEQVQRYSADLRVSFMDLHTQHRRLVEQVPAMFAHMQQPLLQALQSQQAENALLRKELASGKRRQQALMRQVEALRGKIRVVCRVRPLLVAERERNGDDVIVDCIDSTTLSLGDRLFSYDSVLSPHATNDDVFNELDDLIGGVLKGFSLSIFAYGQTNSGKTYTMEGVNRRALQTLFSSPLYNEEDVHLCLSALELHNNTLVDLLVVGEQAEPLEIAAPGSMPQSCFRVPNLTELPLRDFQHCWRLLAQINERRQTHETAANARSSRSHLLVGVSVCRLNSETGERQYARLCLVDLAGSERRQVHSNSSSGNEHERLQEARHINSSLSALGNVFRALAPSTTTTAAAMTTATTGHVPFRDSKLTYAMQDVLDGSARVACVVNVSPSPACRHESLCSLRFAERVKDVELGEVRKRVEHGDYMRYRALADERLAQLHALQMQFDAERLRQQRRSSLSSSAFQTPPPSRSKSKSRSSQSRNHRSTTPRNRNRDRDREENSRALFAQ